MFFSKKKKKKSLKLRHVFFLIPENATALRGRRGGGGEGHEEKYKPENGTANI